MRTEFTRICFIIYYERPHLITKQLDFIHSYTSMTTLLVSHQENTTEKEAKKEAKEAEQTTKLLYCTNSKQSTNKPSPPSQYTLRPTIGKHESFNNCTRNILFGDLPFPLFCWRWKAHFEETHLVCTVIPCIINLVPWIPIPIIEMIMPANDVIMRQQMATMQ